MGLEALGKKLAQLGVDTKNSVQKLNENYQLSSKLSDEKKALEQLYTQIGAAVIEKFAEAGLEGFEDQFAAVAQAKEVIAALEEQVQLAKGIAVCPECGKVAEKGEKFCANCGAALPEVEDLSEKFKQDAKEAGNEVGELVGAAAVKAKGMLAGLADKADAFVKGVKAKAEAEAEEAEEAEGECCCEEEKAEGECCCEEEKAEGECCCEEEKAEGECCCEEEKAEGECCCEEEKAEGECCCEEEKAEGECCCEEEKAEDACCCEEKPAE